MKNLLKIGVTASLVFCSTLAFANIDPIVIHAMESSKASSVFDNHVFQIELMSLPTTENPKPFLRKVGDKVYIDHFNQDRNKVQILVFDEENRLLVNKSSKGKLTIGQVLNFENVKGKFEIQIKDGENTFLENVEIN